ncbi:hypothetical protein [Streptomyces spiralis]|uniref:hypothetical protein n=1 Tax=Streptomyces spiralis TaxID=66376 RepID=UPI001678F641|nr:hypothetical protein [Streptomyces spiralis]
MEDVVRVTMVPSAEDPPYDDEPLWCRLTRVSHWAAAFRLAALAGRWELPEDAGRPTGYRDVDLEKVVSGLYPFFALFERWSDLHEGFWLETEEEADIRLTQLVPSVRTHLSDTENIDIDTIRMTFGNLLGVAV